MKRKIAMLTVGMALFNAKALFVCGGSITSDAHAATASKAFTTTASVSPTCTFASGAIALQFGVYDPQQHVNADSSSVFDIRCTKGAAVTLGLNTGIYNSGTQRRMRNTVSTTDYLNYELYSNSARTAVWDNATTVNFTSTSAINHSFSIYGRIPSGQASAIGGNYADTVTITANF